MKSATLLISHAGAGSVLEGLRLRARMLVVVNDALMDNHQQELAHALVDLNHVVATTPRALVGDLQSYFTTPPQLKPLADADPSNFGRHLTARLGLGGTSKYSPKARGE